MGYARLRERGALIVRRWWHPQLFSLLATAECAEHRVLVEHIPWSDGKRPADCAMEISITA